MPVSFKFYSITKAIVGSGEFTVTKWSVHSKKDAGAAEKSDRRRIEKTVAVAQKKLEEELAARSLTDSTSTASCECILVVYNSR